MRTRGNCPEFREGTDGRLGTALAAGKQASTGDTVDSQAVARLLSSWSTA